MNISYKIGNGTFNYRVAGVLIHNNKVLLSTEKDLDFWYLPGGRVQMFESSLQAIEREIAEELGTKPTIERLLWVAESMFYLNLSDYGNVHEMCFYYLINLPKTADIYQKETFQIHEVDGDKTNILAFTWFDISTLETIALKPAFLKSGIQALPTSTEHLIINELNPRNK